MKSNQEQLNKFIGEDYLGAPFIFFPNEYNKGTAKREPCDVAYFANNCVVLMWMKSSNGSRKDDNKRDSILNKNSKQAVGWMSKWRQGEILTGKNKFQQFNIPYDANYKIILISIYGGVISESVKVDKEKSKSLNVDLYIEISDEVLKLIPQNEATLIDFLYILKTLKVNVIHNDISKRITQYFESENKNFDRGLIKEKSFKLLYNQIKNLRVQKESMAKYIYIPKTNLDWQFAMVLNDISHRDFLSLIVCFYNNLFINYLQSDRVWGVNEFESENYHFLLSVSNLSNSKNNIELVLEYINKYIGQKDLVVIIMGKISTCLIPEIKRISLASRILERKTILERIRDYIN